MRLADLPKGTLFWFGKRQGILIRHRRERGKSLVAWYDTEAEELVPSDIDVVRMRISSRDARQPAKSRAPKRDADWWSSDNP